MRCRCHEPRRLPRHPLTFGPSPIHPLPRLSEHLGGQVEIWAKREDCNSGIAFGGNKVRKLEYLVAEALAQGLRHAGLDRRRAVEPHPRRHRRGRAPRPARGDRARALGRLARRGLRQGRQHPAQPDHGRRRPAGPGRLRHRHSRQLAARAAVGRSMPAARRTPIPAGASDHPLGGLGFANWAREVAAQEAELGIFFDTIIVCTVTGFDACRHDRRVRPRGSRRPSGDRHRRVGDAGQDRRSGDAHRHQHRRGDRRGTCRCAPTRSRSSTATAPASTASPTPSPSMRSARRAGWRAC